MPAKQWVAPIVKDIEGFAFRGESLKPLKFLFKYRNNCFRKVVIKRVFPFPFINTIWK